MPEAFFRFAPCDALQPYAGPQKDLVDGEKKKPKNGQGGDDVDDRSVFVRPDDFRMIGEQKNDRSDKGGSDDRRPLCHNRQLYRIGSEDQTDPHAEGGDDACQEFDPEIVDRLAQVHGVGQEGGSESVLLSHASKFSLMSALIIRKARSSM